MLRHIKGRVEVGKPFVLGSCPYRLPIPLIYFLSQRLLLTLLQRVFVTIFAACPLTRRCVHRCKTWFASDRFLVAPLVECGSLCLPPQSVCLVEDFKSVRGVGGKGNPCLNVLLQFTNYSTSLSYKIPSLKSK